MRVSLPKAPAARQYEDLVAASLAALGYYVETRMRFVGNSAATAEFDAIATPSNESFANRILVEARPEAWGFGDVCRLYGWRMYLGLEQSRLVHLRDAQEYMAGDLKIMANRVGVGCHQLALHSYDLDRSVPRAAPVSEVLRRKLTDAGWFGQISQRIALAQFALYCRQHSDSDLCVAAARYQGALESSFLVRDPLVRMAALYEAHEQCPNLTGRLVESMAVRGKHGQVEIWEKLKDSGETLWLQYVLLVEIKLRAAMVACAVEHLLAGKRLGRQVTYASRTMSDQEFWEEVLPASLRDALTELAAGPYARQMPYIMQSFVETFGGFYIDRADELSLMATVWGVPQEQVQPLLAAVDGIFGAPRGGSWYFREPGGIVFLKFVPAFVRGAGCLLRCIYHELDDYKKKYSGCDLRLARWHASITRVLEAELK